MDKTYQKQIKNRIVGSGDEPVDAILYNPDNWRIHPKFQQDSLLAVLKDIGFVQNIVINQRTGNLVDGHLRCQLAAREGLETIPAVYIDVSKEEEQLLLTSLDPIASMARVDKEKLTELIGRIETESEDVAKLLDEIATRSRLEKTLRTDDTDADDGELVEKYGVEHGALFAVGDHLILCGDATSEKDMSPILKPADMLFTSPPYNMGKSAGIREMDSLYAGADDDKSMLAYLNFLVKFTDVFLSHTKYFFLNIQMLSGNKIAVVEYLHTYKEKLADIAIWDKGRAAPATKENVMNSAFEFVIILSEDGTRTVGTRRYHGTEHNIYHGTPQKRNKFAGRHNATYPLDFPSHFITAFTNYGDTVSDPFIGTGTTLMACENTGRKCLCADISPEYVAITLSRFENTFMVRPERIE